MFNVRLGKLGIELFCGSMTAAPQITEVPLCERIVRVHLLSRSHSSFHVGLQSSERL